MDAVLIRALVREKLRQPETYWIAAIVGTLINAYGHVLVPWVRGAKYPLETLLDEFDASPGITLLTVLLAYIFPTVVGVASAVVALYRGRRIASIADFPDRKPDPVFRADPEGQIMEAGMATQKLFAEHGIFTAQQLVGDVTWREIAEERSGGRGRMVRHLLTGEDYVLSHAVRSDGQINVYMTPFPPPPRTELSS